MIRFTSPAVLWLAAVSLLVPSARAADDDAEQELVIKVYRVLDLVSSVPNYPYEGTFLPTMVDQRLSRPLGGGSAGGGMGGMGGGMGGMGGGMGGGGMGGGMFRVNDNLAQVGGGAPSEAKTGPGGASLPRGSGVSPATGQRPAMRISMNQLVDAITSIVDPDTWDEVGGNGSISPVGGALAIRQTPAVQAKVQEFLQELQREGGTLRPLTIRAQWLWLNQDQVSKLRGGGKAKKADAAYAVDRAALAALPAETRRYAGEITCFNGQTVHLISGELETVIQGAIPVVGGNEVGYQPLLLRPHLGAFLQVTPSLLSGGENVLLDLQSSVTRSDKPGEPTVLHAIASDKPVVQIDRPKISSQEFATSLRTALDAPVVVGGMTFPNSEADTESGQIVLVVEVHASPE